MEAGPILSADDVDISNYNLNEQAYKQAAKAYGYIMGQKLVIDVLSEQFPEYSHALESLELQLYAKFSWPEYRSERVVRELTRDKFDQWVEDYMNPIRGFVDKPYSREQAEGFLSELGARMRGEMDPEVLTTLLWLQYADRPAAEIVDGWTTRFDTRGRVKSLGLDMSFDVPRSWEPKEGIRPHIVQQWTSQYGSGLMTVNLTIKELPLDAKVTFDEMKEYVFSDEIADFVLDEGGLLIRDVVVIDTIPTAVIDQKVNRNIVGTNLTTYQRSYIFFAFNTMTFLSCSVGDAKANEASTQERFHLVVDLCEHIAKTTSVANTYY